MSEFGTIVIPDTAGAIAALLISAASVLGGNPNPLTMLKSFLLLLHQSLSLRGRPDRGVCWSCISCRSCWMGSTRRHFFLFHAAFFSSQRFLFTALAGTVLGVGLSGTVNASMGLTLAQGHRDVGTPDKAQEIIFCASALDGRVGGLKWASPRLHR